MVFPPCTRRSFPLAFHPPTVLIHRPAWSLCAMPSATLFERGRRERRCRGWTAQVPRSSEWIEVD